MITTQRISATTLSVLTAAIFQLGCTNSTSYNEAHPDQFAANTVVIKRDSYGTPHIYSQDNFGLYYGYGYTLAEDRLYQLEILKYATQGRVSEVLGNDWVEFDSNHQKLFWPTDIIKQMAALTTDMKDIFSGMAAGINAQIKSVRAKPETRLPLEFTQNHFMPGQWTDYDVVMLFVGSMLLRYGDFNTEIANAQFLSELIDAHGENAAWAIFDAINPTNNAFAPTVIPEKDWPNAKQTTGGSPGKQHFTPSARSDIPDHFWNKGQEFSNAVVLSEKFLKTDKAVLINGPQFGWYVPAYTYSAGFHTPDWDAVGNAPVGYPLPMFGYNQHITWGTTWGASDNVDIFRETLNPNNLETYKYKGEWQALEMRDISIKIKGRDPVEFKAYKSVHGPIVHSNPEAGFAYAKKRGWEGRELSTLTGWIEATRATDHATWKQAVAKSGLNVNWYFADKIGNIGYFAGGAYPERAADHDNRLPVSGEGDMDWHGIKTASTNPQILNPSSGYVANWNNKPAKGFTNPDEWWYSWSEADRIQILDSLIATRGKMSSDEVWELMMDAAYIDPNAAFFKPLMLEAVKGSHNADHQAVAVQLSDWDNSFVERSGAGTAATTNESYIHPGNAIFRAWLRHMLALTFSDDLPGNIGKAFASTTAYGTPENPTAAGTNISTGSKTLLEALQGRTGYDFFNGIPANKVWQQALDKTVAELKAKYGTNIQDWQLAVPATRLQTKNFLGIPQTAITEQRDDIHDMNRGTENNMTVFSGTDYPTGFEVVPPGQSGFIAPNGIKSPHYADQVELFSSHGKKSVWLSNTDVSENTVSELTLTYERKSRQ